MTDEQFMKEVEDLVEMLKSLLLIRDKGKKRWLKTEIRALVQRLLRD